MREFPLLRLEIPLLGTPKSPFFRRLNTARSFVIVHAFQREGQRPEALAERRDEAVLLTAPRGFRRGR
jgi:hypothetical protein